MGILPLPSTPYGPELGNLTSCNLNLSHYISMYIFSFTSGKSPDDDVRLSALNLKPNTKIMMMGTREENLVQLKL